jgi:hypothetical protein
MVGRRNTAPKTQIAVLTVEWAEPERLSQPQFFVQGRSHPSNWSPPSQTTLVVGLFLIRAGSSQKTRNLFFFVKATFEKT